MCYVQDIKRELKNGWNYHPEWLKCSIINSSSRLLSGLCLLGSLCNFLGYNDIIQWGDSCWPLRHIVIGCSQAQQWSQNSEQTYGHAVPYQMLRERFRPCSRTPSQLLWASDPYRSSTDYSDWSGEQKGHRNGHRAQSSGLLTVIHSLQKRCLDMQRERGIT